jgi:hypothetical protein
MRLFILIIGIICLVSCSSHMMYYNIGSSFPKTESIDLYLGDIPSKGYEIIGLIEIDEKRCRCEKEAIKQAQSVGAHGIILVTPTFDLSSLPQDMAAKISAAPLTNQEMVFFLTIRYLD